MKCFSKLAVAAALTMSFSGCTYYKYAKEINLVGFEEEAYKGKSVGQIEADDCVYHVLGYWMGGEPTFARALQNARAQRKTTVTDAFGGSKAANAADALRYLNNVSSGTDGFDIGLFGKRCVTVTGLGFH